ncbi:uncharacterized protein CBL_10623 [Carabus blaptoides fortunei]
MIIINTHTAITCLALASVLQVLPHSSPSKNHPKMEPHKISIPEFFTGKNIFITGATGFMGKALIEKLLRSCPAIGTIYVLVRPKKGKELQERLQQLTANANDV